MREREEKSRDRKNAASDVATYSLQGLDEGVAPIILLLILVLQIYTYQSLNVSEHYFDFNVDMKMIQFQEIYQKFFEHHLQNWNPNISHNRRPKSASQKFVIYEKKKKKKYLKYQQYKLGEKFHKFWISYLYVFSQNLIFSFFHFQGPYYLNKVLG